MSGEEIEKLKKKIAKLEKEIADIEHVAPKLEFVCRIRTCFPHTGNEKYYLLDRDDWEITTGTLYEGGDYAKWNVFSLPHNPDGPKIIENYATRRALRCHGFGDLVRTLDFKIPDTRMLWQFNGGVGDNLMTFVRCLEDFELALEVYRPTTDRVEGGSLLPIVTERYKSEGSDARDYFRRFCIERLYE